MKGLDEIAPTGHVRSPRLYRDGSFRRLVESRDQVPVNVRAPSTGATSSLSGRRRRQNNFLHVCGGGGAGIRKELADAFFSDFVGPFCQLLRGSVRSASARRVGSKRAISVCLDKISGARSASQETGRLGNGMPWTVYLADSAGLGDLSLKDKLFWNGQLSAHNRWQRAGSPGKPALPVSCGGSLTRAWRLRIFFVPAQSAIPRCAYVHEQAARRGRDRQVIVDWADADEMAKRPMRAGYRRFFETCATEGQAGYSDKDCRIATDDPSERQRSRMSLSSVRVPALEPERRR